MTIYAIFQNDGMSACDPCNVYLLYVCYTMMACICLFARELMCE